MDSFLKALGFGAFARKMLARAGQEMEIRSDRGNKVTIVTSDLRGKSQLELPLGGQGVCANDGDGGETVCREASIDGEAVVITERLPRAGTTLSVCRRSLLPDGRMCIDIKKRTPEGKFVGMRLFAHPMPLAA